MSKLQSNVVLAAFNVTSKTSDLSQAERFLEQYTTAGKQQIENITKIRDELAFTEATKTNSFAAYAAFFKTFGLKQAKG